MRSEIPSDEELKEFAEEHLAYEVNMMIGAAKGLSQPNNSQFVINALLESFTIHLRALIDFIWEPSNVWKDDAIACDFFNSTEQWKKVRPDFPAALEPARSRTGKEVAHLTYARMKVTPETKGWNIGEMTEAMVRALKVFADNADKKRIGKALENL
jgi:hypothetical protein